MAFHASLVIVLLMLYEDSALLVLAVVYSAGRFAGARSLATASEPGASQ